MTLEIVSSNKSFGGWHKRYRHRSSSLVCDMVSPCTRCRRRRSEKPLVLYWLSGLTCTDENFAEGRAWRLAAELGPSVAPDTSPRGAGVPDDPDGAWDFGLRYLLNATQNPGLSITGCTTTWSTSCRHWSRRTSLFRPPGHQRAFDGPRRAGLRAEESRVTGRFGFRTHQQSAQLPVGREGVQPLPGRRPSRWREWDACALIAEPARSC